MTFQLKPCPFCGNTKVLIRSNGIGDFFAQCDGDIDEAHCGASTSDQNCETEKGAADRWNRRV